MRRVRRLPATRGYDFFEFALRFQEVDEEVRDGDTNDRTNRAAPG